MEKLVLIDMDDTILVAVNAANKDASGVMFQKVFGITAHEEMVDNKGKTEVQIITDVLALFGKKVDKIPEEAYSVWVDAMMEVLKKTPPKQMPGATDFLNALQKENIPYCLLTGASYLRAEAKLQSVGLDNYFRDRSGKIKGAFGDQTYKREDLIQIAKKVMGMPHALGIVVDDSLFVAKMVQRLDLPHVMVATGATSAEELKKYTTNVIESFANGGWQKAIEIIKAY